MCNYPACQNEGPIPVLYAPVEIRSCDDHWPEMYKLYFKGKKFNNVNLGQTVQAWTHVDKKSGKEIKHKLSAGKEWEISNRCVAEDGKTVINRATGREAQY